MKCAHCGGPLLVEANKAFAECEYCGKSTRVRGAQTLMAEQPRPVPPAKPPYSPPSYASRPNTSTRRSSASSSSSSSGMGGCMLVFALGFGLISTVLPVLMSNGFSFSSLPLPFLQDPPPVAPLFILTDAESHRIEGVADGNESAAQVADATCSGYLGRGPDLRIQTPSAGVVHLDVAGSGDLTLAVRLSDGRWVCDDDSGASLLPRIVESFPVGEHQVYVGRFSNTAAEAFTLSVSEDMPTLPRPEDALEEKPEEVSRTRRRSSSMRRRSSSMRRASSMHRATPMEEPSMSNEPVEIPQPAAVGTIPVMPQAPQPSANATRSMLSINTTPWSSVRVNGRLVGNTPRTNLIVPVGTVRVEVQREGQGPWVMLSVEVHAGQPARLEHRF